MALRYTKVGNINGGGLYIDVDGDLLLMPACYTGGPRGEAGTWLYISNAGQSLEQLIDQLRACTSNPRDRVIAAARRVVANDDATGGEDYDALVSAVEALESAKCDDA